MVQKEMAEEFGRTWSTLHCGKTPCTHLEKLFVRLTKFFLSALLAKKYLLLLGL